MAEIIQNTLYLTTHATFVSRNRVLTNEIAARRDAKPLCRVCRSHQFPIIREHHTRRIARLQRHLGHVLCLCHAVADERMTQCIVFPDKARRRIRRLSFSSTACDNQSSCLDIFA